jgi:transposase-like protein
LSPLIYFLEVQKIRAKFNQSFKIQAVEKAFSRSGVKTLDNIAGSLGVGCSTLSKWNVKARNQEFDSVSPDEISRMTQDKRPQDWKLKERLIMVVACGSLTGEKT